MPSQYGSLENLIQGALEAMRETQRRAAADRGAAIAAVKEAQMGALGEFAGAEELFRQALKAPEAITPEIASKMYETGRLGIEAETQATQRQLQEAYARRGLPGGAMLGGILSAGEAGAGKRSALRRGIDIERAARAYKDLLSSISAGTTLGSAQAGIYGTAGKTLADIYAQTIAEVPRYAPGTFAAGGYNSLSPIIMNLPGAYSGSLSGSPSLRSPNGGLSRGIDPNVLFGEEERATTPRWGYESPTPYSWREEEKKPTSSWEDTYDYAWA